MRSAKLIGLSAASEPAGKRSPSYSADHSVTWACHPGYGWPMPHPRIAVIFTGGTIAMRSDTGHGGNVPTLGGAALLETVPGLDAIAEIVPTEWGLVPA